MIIVEETQQKLNKIQAFLYKEDQAHREIHQNLCREMHHSKECRDKTQENRCKQAIYPLIEDDDAVYYVTYEIIKLR